MHKQSTKGSSFHIKDRLICFLSGLFKYSLPGFPKNWVGRVMGNETFCLDGLRQVFSKNSKSPDRGFSFKLYYYFSLGTAAQTQNASLSRLLLILKLFSSQEIKQFWAQLIVQRIENVSPPDKLLSTEKQFILWTENYPPLLWTHCNLSSYKWW